MSVEDHDLAPVPPKSEQLKPEPLNSSMGAVQALLVGLLALVMAAAAVALFAILQTGVQCEFRPITYSIFTGVVLAAVGTALGGSAVISGNFPWLGIRAVAAGGAAFLLIVMGAVWLATRTNCEPGADLKLSAVPVNAISGSGLNGSPAYVRVRFDPQIKISELVNHDAEYSIFFFPGGPRALSIQVNLVQNDKSTQVCDIEISKATPALIQSGVLLEHDKFIALERTAGSDRNEGGFELKFRSGFIEDVLSKYQVEKKQSGGSNDCIQINFSDPSDGHVKSALVNEIYFVEPSFAERMKNVSPMKGDLSALLGSFKLYAVRAAQAPNPVSDVKNDPIPARVPTVSPPTSPAASCVTGNTPSSAVAALESLKQTGVVSGDDVKTLFEHWCEVEKSFYDILQSSADPTLRYRFIRFIRSSITAIDICWASNDSYRLKSAGNVTCDPRPNRPRNFSRSLPFANRADQKAVILGLLRDESVQVHREVEILLRLYPHDDFDGLFDQQIAAAAHPGDFAQTYVPAAISYYYNRVVEQGWAESVEKATWIAVELGKGLKWVGNLAPTDRAIARARLHYGAASAYIQATGDKDPSSDVTNQIKSNFTELLKLSGDEMAAYPYPHHLARAFSYVRGSAEQTKRFDTYKIDNFERVSPSKAVAADAVYYERNVWTLPDAKSTPTRLLLPEEQVQILMTVNNDAEGGVWQFVSSKSDVGWIKRKGKQS
jgi:hypothetical protein